MLVSCTLRFPLWPCPLCPSLCIWCICVCPCVLFPFSVPMFLSLWSIIMSPQFIVFHVLLSQSISTSLQVEFWVYSCLSESTFGSYPACFTRLVHEIRISSKQKKMKWMLKSLRTSFTRAWRTTGSSADPNGITKYFKCKRRTLIAICNLPVSFILK